MKSNHEILEETGYSYSGISNIIHNEPENTKRLLHAINSEYLAAKEKQAQLEKELEAIKLTRGFLVSSFLHAHQALKLGGKPLCFIQGNTTVVVKRLEGDRIDYESYELV